MAQPPAAQHFFSSPAKAQPLGSLVHTAQSAFSSLSPQLAAHPFFSSPGPQVAQSKSRSSLTDHLDHPPQQHPLGQQSDAPPAAAEVYPPSPAVVEPVDHHVELNLWRSNRPQWVPTKFKDYVCHATWSSTSISLFFSSSSFLGLPGTVPYLLTHFLSYDKFFPSHWSFVAAISAGIELTMYLDAICIPEWRTATQQEILLWWKTIPGYWLHYHLAKELSAATGFIEIKYKFDGSIERYKAHLVFLRTLSTKAWITLKLSLLWERW